MKLFIYFILFFNQHIYALTFSHTFALDSGVHNSIESARLSYQQKCQFYKSIFNDIELDLSECSDAADILLLDQYQLQGVYQLKFLSPILVREKMVRSYFMQTREESISNYKGKCSEFIHKQPSQFDKLYLIVKNCGKAKTFKIEKSWVTKSIAFSFYKNRVPYRTVPYCYCEFDHLDFMVGKFYYNLKLLNTKGYFQTAGTFNSHSICVEKMMENDSCAY